jgi:hypothetical protein
MSYSIHNKITANNKFVIYLDVSERQEANDDYEHHKEYYSNNNFFEWDLLEDLTCNSEFNLVTSGSIYSCSITQKTRDGLMNYLHYRDAMRHSFLHDDDGIKLPYDYDQQFIAELWDNDHGDIEKIYRMWIMPDGWMEAMLAGVVIFCEPIDFTYGIEENNENN